MTSIALLGILSTVLTVFSRANYFVAMFRGRVRPHAFSWFIWAVISSIGVAAQVVEGAGAGSWARIAGSASCYLVVIFALMQGARDNITRSDWITLIVALSAIPLWIATKTPVWSVIIVCVIDTLGYIPTVRKSWEKPYEEAASSYAFSAFSAFFSVAAVESYSLSTWLYPAVLGVSNVCLALFLLLRRKHLKRVAPPPHD